MNIPRIFHVILSIFRESRFIEITSKVEDEIRTLSTLSINGAGHLPRPIERILELVRGYYSSSRWLLVYKPCKFEIRKLGILNLVNWEIEYSIALLFPFMMLELEEDSQESQQRESGSL